jgi:hypothetical protein
MFYHYFHRTLPTNCLSQCVCVHVYDTSFDQLGISFKKLQIYFNLSMTLFKVINSNSSGTSYTWFYSNLYFHVFIEWSSTIL